MIKKCRHCLGVLSTNESEAKANKMRWCKCEPTESQFYQGYWM